MSNKLEALSQPVAFVYQIAGACVSDYPNPCGKWVDWRTELSCECPPDWMIEEGKVKDLKPRYSQEYVTALLAALEEANSKNFQTQMFEWIGRYEAERKRVDAAEQRLQQPIKLPKGFSHQDGAPHALLGTGDVMISHIKWADAQGIAFAPMPAGKAGIGVNVDADVAGKSSDEIGAVFVVKATSVPSLEVLKEAVQMAIDGFKVEGE